MGGGVEPRKVPSDSRRHWAALGEPLDLSEPWSSCWKWGSGHLMCGNFVKLLPERGLGAELLCSRWSGREGRRESWAGLKVDTEHRWGLRSPMADGCALRGLLGI